MNRWLIYTLIVNLILESCVTYYLVQLRNDYTIVVWAARTLKLDHDEERRLLQECRLKQKFLPVCHNENDGGSRG